MEKKIPMRARQAFTYAGKKLVPGSAFNAAGQSDRRLLAAIGRAEDAPEPAMPAVVVTKAAEKVAAKPRGFASGTYKRRDMVAQVPAEPAVAPAAPASAPPAPAAPAAEPKPAASTDVGAVTTHDYSQR